MTETTDHPQARPTRVGLVSLGCAKNLVDAEIMLGSLLKDGMEVTNDPALADALIVNTCSFIDAAQEESVDAILESTAFRSRHRPRQAVIVSGCLPQRFRDDLPKLLPEVDAFMGIDQVEQAATIVQQAIAQRALKHATRRHRGAGPSEADPKNTTRGKERRRSVETPPIRTDQAAPGSGNSPDGRELRAPVPAEDSQMATDGDASAPIRVNRRPSYIPNWDTPHFRLTPRHFAYLKIAEGCNHPCSFCIIPRMRGGHRSRALADIVKEARRLIESGVRELNLISQDSTYYGLDLRPDHQRSISSPERFRAAARAVPADGPSLGALLRALNALEGDFWVRLLYTHPAHWTDDLIGTIAECPKVARYVDMPLQHIHDDLLARMRRETSQAYIRDLIHRIRAGIPGITLRTTFIVGFPGETPEHFQALLEFIRETRFERLGIFTYSREDGTIAGKMRQQIPQAVRRKRRDSAMAEQHGIARELAASHLGEELRVLVEGAVGGREFKAVHLRSWEHGHLREAESPDKGLARRRSQPYWIARGEGDAPDIDGRVYVRGPMKAGEFARVRVIGHTDYDLLAEPLG